MDNLIVISSALSSVTQVHLPHISVLTTCRLTSNRFIATSPVTFQHRSAHYSVMPVEHALPFDRNLLITTPKAIHLRTLAGDKTIFECESADGIVYACAAPGNSSLLAIADSHGVILHDTTQPRERKHKLKGASVSRNDLAM